MTGPLSPLQIEQLAAHRQSGSVCEGCGQTWPCATRREAPDHYRPGRPVHGVDEAREVIARHTERDAHCTACGEEWSGHGGERGCASWRQAMRVYERHERTRRRR